ncbi:MAG: hypothetical protein A2Y97_09120 [Nitrospirae bacterium RBG_13_39_12]|nr:MAG: hypothetical protein A2Y97_09120 [Nitrospirae bacterium RBG_13_39_12]
MIFNKKRRAWHFVTPFFFYPLYLLIQMTLSGLKPGFSILWHNLASLRVPFIPEFKNSGMNGILYKILTIIVQRLIIDKKMYNKLGGI